MLKYVVTRWSGGNETMFIFPNWVEHSKFSKYFGVCLSAGFINMKTKTCYGKSLTLNLSSNPETDNILLETLLKEEI